MDYQTHNTIIIILSALGVVIFHLSISVLIWLHRPRLGTLWSLAALSALTYVICSILDFVLTFMNGFPRTSEGRMDIATADWTFNFILNPCGRFPWFEEHLGPFLCGVAVLLFGPSVFFALGVLPKLFIRDAPKA